MASVSSDPDTHVKKVKLLEKMGATAVCVMDCAGPHAHETLRTYGEHVLPELRKD
jgi:coenzyme F420-dependent glucose-6-phosphate dehydrogenase